MDVSTLNSIPLFAALPRRERKVVAQHADEVQYAKGAMIVEEGRLASELFVIMTGTVDVLVGGSTIASLGPGDVVGEIGVLKTIKRTASVVATSPVEAIVMWGPEVKGLRTSMPHVWAELERLVEERTGAD
jgi:CRP-like cAMP-binding protein